MLSWEKKMKHFCENADIALEFYFQLITADSFSGFVFFMFNQRK